MPITYAVGYYTPTDAFRAIAEHVCVVREDQEGGGTPVAICGPTGDAVSEQDARVFAAAYELLAFVRQVSVTEVGTLSLDCAPTAARNLLTRIALNGGPPDIIHYHAPNEACTTACRPYV